MSQETPTRVAALKRGASHRPAGTFLAVFVTYSALVATVSYRTGRNSSGSEDIVYAWGPMISAGCWMRAFVTGSDNSGTHGFVVTLFLAGTLEELGWRGFLQPRLRQRFDVVWVSIGIGVTWVVRHVPMMVAGFGDFAAFWEHTLSDILPRVKSWASHARLRWFGNLRLRPDTPMGVPRPRYSYPVKDSELSGCFTSVEVSEGLLFDEANTESTASFRTVNHDGSPS